MQITDEDFDHATRVAMAVGLRGASEIFIASDGYTGAQVISILNIAANQVDPRAR